MARSTLSLILHSDYTIQLSTEHLSAIFTALSVLNTEIGPGQIARPAARSACHVQETEISCQKCTLFRQKQTFLIVAGLKTLFLHTYLELDS